MSDGKPTGPLETDRRIVRVDPHVHTEASYDGHVSPETLVERAEAVGLDAVVVTDHDTLAGARACLDRAADADLEVVVGCEVSTADGHLLALGVDEAIDPNGPLPETARAVRARGGVAIVPHPFQRSRHGACRSAIEAVDGVEVFNAHTLTGFRNDQATRFAVERGYPEFGGSDAHRPGGIGRGATEVSVPAGEELSSQLLLEAMREGRTRAIGKRASPRSYLGKVVESATRKTRSLL